MTPMDENELRRELERLPVASALLMAAGAEGMTVPVTVPSRPDAADVGRSGPFAAQTTSIAESPNVARLCAPGPHLADAGRSGPQPDEAREGIGPAGLEPATERV